MRGALFRWADWLDTWLKEHVGRLYNALLGLGLGLGIMATIKTIETAVGAKDIVALAATLVFEAALLINQLAQLHHFREEIRARREAHKAAKS